MLIVKLIVNNNVNSKVNRLINFIFVSNEFTTWLLASKWLDIIIIIYQRQRKFIHIFRKIMRVLVM